MSNLRFGFIFLFGLMVACSSASEGDLGSSDGLTIMPPSDGDGGGHCGHDDCEADDQCDDWQTSAEGDHDDCELDCPRGGPTGPIAVHFDCTEVHIVSCKELSNVVLAYADGEHSKFDGLKGHYGTFGGGEREIVSAWVKAGNNASGDGPGYGERFDSDAECDDGGGTGGSGGDGMGGAGGMGGDDGTGGAGGMGGDDGTGGMGGWDCHDGHCNDGCDDRYQTCKDECDSHYEWCKDECDDHYDGCKYGCDHRYDDCKPACDDAYDGCKYDCDDGYEYCKHECGPDDQYCKDQCDEYYEICKDECDHTYDGCKYGCDHTYDGCKYECDQEYDGCKPECDHTYDGCKYECDHEYGGCKPECDDDDDHYGGGHHCSCDPWLECPHGGSEGYIEAKFDCSAVHVSSCKDISNIVLELSTGEHRKFDDLDGQCLTIGVGDKHVVRAWVKAGNNASGDGPGYGTRFDSGADCTP